MVGRVWRALRRFGAERAANVLVMFGLGAPALFGAVGVALDYASWRSQVQVLQNAADAAALAVVSDMQVAAATSQRMQAVAESQVRALAASRDGDGPVSVATQAVYRASTGGAFVPTLVAGDSTPPTGATVTLTWRKRAIMSRLVTPLLTDIAVTATAETLGTVKVCVVALDAAGSSTVALTDLARVEAGNCSVYASSPSPTALDAQAASLVTSLRTCAVGGYAGSGANFRPAPITGCPAIRDPLADRVAPAVGGCSYTNLTVSGESRVLSPGTYCGGLTVAGDATVTLNPGVYVMKDGPLVVGPAAARLGVTAAGLGTPSACADPTATINVNLLNCTVGLSVAIGSLKGTNVGFYFTGTVAPDSDGVVRPLNFLKNSRVELTAPRTGDMAGLLFHEDRAAPEGRRFEITSDSARRLVGTIYLPRGTFAVAANQVVADLSEYTAIVARRITLAQAPRLVINADYAATDVPVPKGLGPTSSMPVLTR
ncbi:pilus assembly protein TadG-related protein [Methylobacterium sp. JK268]